MIARKINTPLGKRLILRQVKKNKKAEVHLLDLLALILRTYSDSENLRIYICNGKQLKSTFNNLIELTNFFNEKIKKDGPWSRIVAFQNTDYLLLSFVNSPKED